MQKNIKILYNKYKDNKDTVMTDISKYKSVALSHEACEKLDKICKAIVPTVKVSRAKALELIINEKVVKLNGKLRNKSG